MGKGPKIPFSFGHRKKDKDDERRAKLVERANGALERGLDLISRCDVVATAGRPEKTEMADMVARALNGEPMLGYDDDMSMLDESEPEDVSDVEDSDDDENADPGEDIVDEEEEEEEQPAGKD
jgi:hypothetical protein